MANNSLTCNYLKNKRISMMHSLHLKWYTNLKGKPADLMHKDDHEDKHKNCDLWRHRL